MDDIACAHGNTVRWWLHTDGSACPLYGDDGKVSGLYDNEIKNLKRAIDLAYERGILVMPVLWVARYDERKGGGSGRLE
jgi:hypothetical protein